MSEDEHHTARPWLSVLWAAGDLVNETFQLDVILIRLELQGVFSQKYENVQFVIL